MSFVIATLYKNQIIMASDGQVSATDTLEIVDNNYKKIRRFENFIIGYTGCKEYCEFILDNISYNSSTEDAIDLIKNIMIINGTSNSSKMIIAGKYQNKNALINIDSNFPNNYSVTFEKDNDLQYAYGGSEYLDDKVAGPMIYNCFVSNFHIGLENILKLVICEISKIDQTVNDTIFVEKM